MWMMDCAKLIDCILCIQPWQNERQRSINKFWSCVLENHTSDRLYLVIKVFLPVFIGKTDCNTLSAPSWKWASMERQQLFALHHGWSQRKAVVIVFLRRFAWFCWSKGSKTVGGSSVNKINCYCPGGCSGKIPHIFSYKGCHILVYGWFWSSAADITEDASAKIVDAPLTLIFKMGLGSCSFLYCLQRRPIQSFWVRATSHPPDYPTDMTTNRWHSVDTYFEDVVGWVLLFALIMMVASRSKTVTYVPMLIFCIQQSHIWVPQWIVKPETQNRRFEPTALA